MAKTNVKAMTEQRAAALKTMDELLAGASAETRALTEEVRAIDATPIANNGANLLTLLG